MLLAYGGCSGLLEPKELWPGRHKTQPFFLALPLTQSFGPQFSFWGLLCGYNQIFTKPYGWGAELESNGTSKAKLSFYFSISFWNRRLGVALMGVAQLCSPVSRSWGGVRVCFPLGVPVAVFWVFLGAPRHPCLWRTYFLQPSRQS